MEASPLSTSDTDNWSELFGQSLNLQRDRIREFLAAQQERLQSAEAELGRRIEQFADQLARDRGEFRRAREEVDQRSEQLTREAQTLEGLKEELEARQAEWEQFQQRALSQQEALAKQIQQQQDQWDRQREELATRQSEIDAAEAKLHQDQQAWDLARQEHQTEVERLATLREQLEARRVDFDAGREQVAAREADTESRRRRIAREFKTRHTKQLKELQRRRKELQQRDTRLQAELERQLEDARKRQAELEAEIEAGRQRSHELEAEVEASRQRARELEAELESVRGKCDQLAQDLARPTTDGGADTEALENGQQERDALLERLCETEDRLAEAQRNLAEAQQGGAASQTADEELQCRYEMALEDLRELKASNAELQEQLTQARSAPVPAAAAGGTLDWESEKNRILSALESDYDEEDEQAAAERLQLEKVVQETDRVLAEKDRECNELKRLLEEQSANLGTVAVGAAAIGEALDADAVVQEEREKLGNLQQQWREKLRQAEVDISIERAKLARDRAAIEEKLHMMEKRGGRSEGGSDDLDASGKPARGRWLERLGLKDAEEE